MSGNDEKISSLGMRLWLLGGASAAIMKYAGICINSKTISKVDNLIGGVWITAKLFDICFNFFVFILVGWGLAMGKDSGAFFGGSSQYFCLGLEDDSGGWTTVFFLYILSAIFLVVITEVMRSHLLPLHTPYQAITLLMIAFVFPVMVHWVWSDQGWASPYRSSNPDGLLLGCGVLDVNGSSIIHMASGLCCLAFDYAVTTDLSWLHDLVEQQLTLHTDHDTVLLRKLQSLRGSVEGVYHQSLAVLMIWLGSYGLIVINMPTDNDNASSSVEIRMINVTMAATASCVMGLLVHYSGLPELLTKDGTGGGSKGQGQGNVGFMDQKKPKQVLMGVYTALISIAGSCATAEPAGAAVIGCIAALLNTCSDKFLTYLGIPRRTSAYSVHLVGGLWGLVAPGFFTSQKNYAVLMGTAFSAADLGGTANKGRFFTTYDESVDSITLTATSRSELCAGVFYGGDGSQLGANVIFGLALLVWCVVPMYALVKVLMAMFPEDFSEGNVDNVTEEQEKELLQTMKRLSNSSWYEKLFGGEGGGTNEERGRRERSAHGGHSELCPGHAMDSELSELDDAFYDEFKYSWDAVMVLPLHPTLLEHQEKMFYEAHPMARRGSLLGVLASVTAHHDVKPIKADYPSALEIIQALRYKNIETHQFYSAHHDLIFVKVRARPQTLREHADRLDFPIELDPKEVKEACFRGVDGELVGGKKVTIKRFEIYDGKEENITSIKPYDHIYAKMDDEIFNATPKLYKEYRNLGHAFGPVTRLRILDSLVKQALTESLYKRSADKDTVNTDMHSRPHSLTYTYEDLISPEKGAIKAWFPLHDEEDIFELKQKIFSFSVVPGSDEKATNSGVQDLLRNYLGEEIALYFKFLTHYIIYLAPIAVLGAASTLNVLLLWLQSGDYFIAVNSAWSVPLFALVVCGWALVFTRTWATKEKYYAMRWGSTEFEETEVELPSYEGNPKRSYIDGSWIKIVDRKEQSSRGRVSTLVISSLSMLVIGVIAVTFYFKFWMITHNMADYSVIADLMNALTIAVLDVVYKDVAMAMTSYENHRTQTSFNDSMITKLFLFSFANSYAPAIYIAFLKRAVGDACLNSSCMGELGMSMAVIFSARNVGQHVITYVTPRIPKWKDAIEEKVSSCLLWQTSVLVGAVAGNGDSDEAEDKDKDNEQPHEIFYAKKSTCEDQYIRPKYDNVFSDYNELSVQFGFLCLFSAAFPVAPVLAIINNFFEVRSDGSKMLDAFRRPWPLGAEDIGSWYPIFQIIGALSIISNAGILSWTMDLFGEDMPATSRLAIFIVFVLVNFLLRAIIAQISFGKQEDEADIQLARQAHIVRKIIDKVPDEMEYVEDSASRKRSGYATRGNNLFSNNENIYIASAALRGDFVHPTDAASDRAKRE